MTKLLGTHANEFLGKGALEIGLFSDMEACKTAFRDCSRTVIFVMKTASSTIDGKRREVEFVSTSMTNTTIKLFNATIRTSRTQAREEERNQLLASALAARQEPIQLRHQDEFSATLSHELRYSTDSILGWSDLLANGNLTGEESKRALELSCRNAARKSNSSMTSSTFAHHHGKLRLGRATRRTSADNQGRRRRRSPRGDARNIHTLYSA